MLLKNIKQDFPIALLSFFAARLPSKEKLWAQAMLAELAQIHNPSKRLIWALSGSWGLGKIWARALRRTPQPEDESRPLAVTLIALYHALFSFVILGVLIWQLPRVKAPRLEACIPVLIDFFIALIPCVIAVGLWVLDDVARFLAMLLSLLHALGNCALISTRHLGWELRPVSRIALDIVIIGVLSLPAMRRAFRPPKVELKLRS
jgi:hypothetical protein